MPLYDCILLLKPQVDKGSVANVLTTLGRLVQAHNGVITDVKSFGNIHLAYKIKKLSERFSQGQMLQMTVMSHPKLNRELQYLNKENSILRWILVKNRGTKWLSSDSQSSRVGYQDA